MAGEIQYRTHRDKQVKQSLKHGAICFIGKDQIHTNLLWLMLNKAKRNLG